MKIYLPSNNVAVKMRTNVTKKLLKKQHQPRFSLEPEQYGERPVTNLSHDPILVDLVRRSSLIGFGEVRPIRGYACHLCRLPRPGIIRDNFVFCHSALLSELNEEYELCTPETCQSVIQQSTWAR